MGDYDDYQSKHLANGVWSEKVVVITDSYEITGHVFLPKTGRKERLISNILNSKKRFIAIKNYELKNIKNPNIHIERGTYLQVNTLSIILMKPI